MRERNQLYEKLDQMSRIQSDYENLQEEYDNYQQMFEEKTEEYQEAAKAITNEVIVLAAQNSRLEQRIEELQTELGQRIHEIELLSQANVIQTRQLRLNTVADQVVILSFFFFCFSKKKKKKKRNSRIQWKKKTHTHTLPFFMFLPPDLNELTGLTQASTDHSYVLAQLDYEIGNEAEEEITSEPALEEQEEGHKKNEKETGDKVKKMSEKDKEEFVADVIKEYLHLSASSVKIKYPLVTTISNEALIEQTKHLPFYQYHDFMVRIMEKEIKRMEDEKRKKKEEELRQHRKSIESTPKLTSRRSILGNFFGLLFAIVFFLFCLFGAKDDIKEESGKEGLKGELNGNSQCETKDGADSSQSSIEKARTSKSSGNLISPMLAPTLREHSAPAANHTQKQTKSKPDTTDSTVEALKAPSSQSSEEKNLDDATKESQKTIVNPNQDNIEEILDGILDNILDDDPRDVLSPVAESSVQ
ncbi:hypothetical protein RFI_16606 [Reticulomyxa filosa]|uniref:Uncharacterized protein n=1 Tax=Reticulomyxa filosa TaxID=46433 RepID=X6N5M4_RETFI|nr:hypothetical protein RFI_16606 [Reticulomyxa filosa]|eukprot:ETO20612.1 hypothetical protein RFI_16606 [Reticulomyxa filosa]